jgi:hypothetical protein
MFDTFDIQIHSDELAWKYEEVMRYEEEIRNP